MINMDPRKIDSKKVDKKKMYLYNTKTQRDTKVSTTTEKGGAQNEEYKSDVFISTRSSEHTWNVKILRLYRYQKNE